MSILKKKVKSAQAGRYTQDVNVNLQREEEIKSKIAMFARSLDLTVNELREMVPVEDDYDPLHEMFALAIQYREQRKHEACNSRRCTSKRNLS